MEVAAVGLLIFNNIHFAYQQHTHTKNMKSFIIHALYFWNLLDLMMLTVCVWMCLFVRAISLVCLSMHYYGRINKLIQIWNGLKLFFYIFITHALFVCLSCFVFRCNIFIINELFTSTQYGVYYLIDEMQKLYFKVFFLVSASVSINIYQFARNLLNFFWHFDLILIV